MAEKQSLQVEIRAFYLAVLSNKDQFEALKIQAPEQYAQTVRRERIKEPSDYLVCALGEKVDGVEIFTRPRLLRWRSTTGLIVSLWAIDDLDKAFFLFRAISETKETDCWLSNSTFYQDL